MKENLSRVYRSLLVAAAAVLLFAVSPPNTQTQAQAALSMGQLHLASDAATLERQTSDPRPAVRALSVYGLGLIGLREDVRYAITAAHDPSSAVRLAAIDAIGRYEEAGTLDPATEHDAQALVEYLLVVDGDMYVRGRAALTLASFSQSPHSSSALSTLEEAAASGQDYVRERAWWALFRDYAKRVPKTFLQRGLRDSDEIIRIEAVRAYGKLTDADLVAVLKPLLDDPSWRVQEQAAESIRVLQGGKMTDHLTQIPAGVHIPERQPDPLAGLPSLPRTATHAGAPTLSDVPRAPELDPQTAEQMVEPAHGPHPRVRIHTTQGDIYVVLYPEWAPLTVANFLNLTNRGFYDNNRWFRIVPDFVVQTGEQDDKNDPGPGYTIPAEQNPLEQSSYVISMGLDYDGSKPKLHSAGSEYYITLSPQYHLDGPFTVFGAVTSGFDVLGRLTESDRVIRIDRIQDAML